ncbi:hypothetical protein VHEMI04016 [[Torrubiella] hemipterigena]|uniref:ABC transporter n=1 Tax=[Torrubiella] hemipterigena TaxID=1531966 RepID=A0A0A1T045_9HYPO|nr:hypothetical protein VHEMI04016 [[Torrubiella] hemipterigena]
MDTQDIASGLAEDKTFGPQVSYHFDFTLYFEQIFFTLVPACIFICCMPHYVLRVRQGTKVVRAGYLFWAKLALGLILLGSLLADVVVWSTLATFRTKLGIFAGSVNCVAAVCVLFALYAEHFYSHHPSLLLGLYFVVSFIFDIAILRSYSLRQIISEVSLRAVVLASRVGLIALGEVSKRSLFISDEKKEGTGKEAVTGLLGRAFFVWLNTTFWLGSKTHLEVKDLDNLDEELKSARVCRDFQRHWSQVNKKSRFALLRAFLKTLGKRQLVMGAAICWLNVACSYLQPFIIQAVVAAMGETDLPDHTRNGLIVSTMLAYLLYAATRAFYQQAMARSATVLRGSLLSAVFDKVTELNVNHSEDGTALALITVDIPGMEQILKRLNDTVGGLISIIAGIVYLSMTVGAASIFAVVPIIVASILAYMLSTRIKRTQKNWNDSIESRVNAIKDVLANFKSIRMTGLTGFFTAYMKGKLRDEITASKHYRFYHSLLFGLELVSIAMTPVLILVGTFLWTRKDEHIPVATVYAILAVSVLIIEPLGQLVHTFSFLARVFACHDRIQAFLVLDPMKDFRKPHKAKNRTSSSKSVGNSKTLHGLEGTAVDVERVYSRPTSDGRQVLQNISASFPAQKVTAIQGSVGDGKSTLLQLLIGEVPLSRGTLKIEVNNIAYCAQLPWIPNKRVKDLISGHYQMSDAWYREVTRACCLDADFSTWQTGDKKETGNGGSNLSGGQKQRVALARALYTKKPIMILDDIFSGLDGQTSSAIFENLFGQAGLLRRSKSTVIMVTSLAEHLRYADNILRFDESRSLVEVDRDSIMSPPVSPEDLATIPNNVTTEGSSLQSHAGPPTTPSSATSNTGDIEADAQQDARPFDTVNEVSKDVKVDSEIDDGSPDTAKKPPTDGRAYFYYLGSFGVRRMAFWIVWIALGEALFKGPNIYLRDWLANEDYDRNSLLGYVLIAVSGVIFSTLSILYYFVFLIATSYDNIHNKLLHATMAATWQFLSTTDTGSLLNRFGQDMVLSSQDLPYSLMYGLMQFFSVLVGMGIIASGVYYAAVVVPLFFAFLVRLQRFYLKTSRQMRLLQIEATAPLYTLFNETASGIQHIRAFKWTSFYQEELIETLDYAQRPFYQMLSIQQWLFLVLDLGVCALATVAVALGLYIRETSSANGLGLALISFIALSVEISLCLRHWADAETSIGAVSRVLDYEESTPKERQLTPDDDDDDAIDSCWPEEGRLNFSKVIAQYNSADPNSPQALIDVAFEARPGETVGIIGRTGSGKSSILMVILQMMDYVGSIQIDGVELRSIPPETIRSRITTITQDTVHIPGSIRLNMDPFGDNVGRSVNDKELVDVLQKVGLWEHIARRGGLDALLSKVKLSDGQRQMLNVARGIVHHIRTDSRIALLDEITSQVDSKTDEQIQIAISCYFRDCTVLAIAHRLETLRHADTIMTVTSGRISVISSARYWSRTSDMSSGQSGSSRDITLTCSQAPESIEPPEQPDRRRQSSPCQPVLPSISAIIKSSEQNRHGPAISPSIPTEKADEAQKPCLPSIRQILAFNAANPSVKLCFKQQEPQVVKKHKASSGTLSQKQPLPPIYERDSMDSGTHFTDLIRPSLSERTAPDPWGLLPAKAKEDEEEDSSTENGGLNLNSQGDEQMGLGEIVTGWLEHVEHDKLGVHQCWQEEDLGHEIAAAAEGEPRKGVDDGSNG